MELIIKATGVCNFNCTFCSASELDIMHPADGKVPQPIRDFISKANVKRIIVTGGEPLCVSPSYYYELHELVPDITISITSNMKDFYVFPDKWTPLFKEKWFNVNTSFNYGETRRWDVNTVYTEEMFIKVKELFKEKVGKDLHSFIAVIDDSNEDTFNKHVQLAKKLGMIVKLNNALGVGRQGTTYQRYRMFPHYFDLIDDGTGDDIFEANCCERCTDRCPRNQNFMCHASIRCCYVDKSGKLRVANCDECASLGIFLPEEEWFLPEGIMYDDAIRNTDCHITKECVYCELFRICNGCNVNRVLAKEDPNYCTEMKKLLPKFKEQGWQL